MYRSQDSAKASTNRLTSTKKNINNNVHCTLQGVAVPFPKLILATNFKCAFALVQVALSA
jgi:hypothetical protein